MMFGLWFSLKVHGLQIGKSVSEDEMYPRPKVGQTTAKIIAAKMNKFLCFIFVF